MHHHHQFTSAAAAAAAATYPNHQFYQHPEISSHLVDQHSNHHHQNQTHQTSLVDAHNNQWVTHHTQQQQHHQHQLDQHHQQQQVQQQQHLQSQHQQSQPSQNQNNQLNQQQTYHNHHNHHQSQQHPNYYAVINALNGYHHQQNLDSSHNYVASQCDTNSVVAAVAVANTFAQYHLDHHHHHHQQDSQAAQPQTQHQHQQAYVGNHEHQHLTPQYSTASSSPPNSNTIQKSIRDTTQTSAINQLQAFALSAPEAAAAAAAAAAAVTFTPFYSAGPTRVNSTTTNNQAPTGNEKVTKIQRQRATPKAKPAKRQDSSATTISSNQRDNNNQQPPQTNMSRSQRRYAGRASCDCPNCIELERLKRQGLEPPTAENGISGGELIKKLMHVCHHAGCGKEYEKTSHLRAHLRWHTSERLSACRHSDCGKRFTRTDELRKHMKTHHSQPADTQATNNKRATQVKQHAE